MNSPIPCFKNQCGPFAYGCQPSYQLLVVMEEEDGRSYTHGYTDLTTLLTLHSQDNAPMCIPWGARTEGLESSILTELCLHWVCIFTDQALAGPHAGAYFGRMVALTTIGAAITG